MPIFVHAPLLALVFLVASMATGLPRDPLTAPGISRELAAHRAASISDVRYALELRVPAARDSAVEGRVVVRFRLAERAPVVLDFANTDGVRAVRVGHSGIHAGLENGHIIIPAGPLIKGENEVQVDFVAGNGPLNRRDDFLYTLFVPDRAHEAFPCFDQPDLKAPLRLTLDVPAEWKAVANGEPEAVTVVGGVARYRFAETRPLPTYLFAFAAGRFRVEEAVRDGRRIRLFHRETDAAKVARNVDALFDLHAAALKWLEAYTGIPYPFGKFDFVAIPSFQYSGMEHPGAILYRASTLFLDESATRNQELGRANTIAHETAHMWFGDLVTMRWFDDVWMKEVFANFMAAKIVNPSFPDVNHELRFLLAHYPAAYAVDRTAGTNAIRQELENLDDAGSLYGNIIYEKAPIVMRQLESLTGEGAFRTALRQYLAAHQYGNASWSDLVADLDRVTPMDVAAWSRVWIDEPGRPTIAVERGTDSVALLQLDVRGRGLVWPQRTTVRALESGAWSDRTVTLSGDEATVDLPDASIPSLPALLPNGYGMGYGLFLLDSATVAALLGRLPEMPDPVARAAGWIDLWEMMLEGQVPPGAMLDLAVRLSAPDQDELVAEAALSGLETLFWRYTGEAGRRSLAARLEPVLWSRIGQAASSSARGAYLDAWRSIALSTGAVTRMRALWSGDDSIPGLPLSERDRTDLALALAVREAPGWAEVLRRQRDDIDNPDRRARFDFLLPAVSADTAVRDSFFRSLADPANRTHEEWVVTALRYLHHPLRAQYARKYIRPGLDLLEEIHDTGDIFFPGRWLGATLGGHRSPAAAAIVEEFVERRPDLPPRLLGKVLQEADPLFRAAALR